MNSKSLLRVSAVLVGIHAIIHVCTYLQWQKATDPATAAIVKNQLPAAKLSFLGITHTLSDYFSAYAYIVALFLLLVAALLWALGDICVKFPAPGLKMLIPIIIFLVVLFFYTIIFFIPGEAGFSGIAILLCSRAIVMVHKEHVDDHAAKTQA